MTDLGLEYTAYAVFAPKERGHHGDYRCKGKEDHEGR